VDSGAAAGAQLPLGNREITVDALESFDFSSVQLAFFTAGAATAAAYAARAAAAGCIVIDTSSQFRGDAAVPLVIPELNAAAMSAVRGGGIVACPGAAGIALALVLKPLHDAAGVQRVNVFSGRPVSEDGRAAVEELAQQTRALLNFQDLPRNLYPKQIAFNLLPVAAGAEDEAAAERELRRLLGNPALAVNLSAIHVPVFYGYSLAVNLETRDKLTVEQVRALLGAAPGLELPDEAAEGVPTAVTEASGQDAVFVGRISEDRSHAHGLRLWITMDNLRKGSALNAVQVGEVLVRDYL
jgi:aspartate-semialdehyde dehydrogenase